MVARNRFTLREDVNESELSEQRVMPSLLGGVQIPVTRSIGKGCRQAPFSYGENNGCEKPLHVAGR